MSIVKEFRDYVSNLENENAELKKQLSEIKSKAITPKGQEVRNVENGSMWYSTGQLDKHGYLLVSHEKYSFGHDAYIINWEEIEVKVKNADT